MDRGNKLWVGHRVILPEHRDIIREEKQKQQEYKPPELMSDALDEIARLISWSMVNQKNIEVIYASKYGPKRCIGYVTRVNQVERWLVIQNEDEKKLIPLSGIIGVEEVRQA